MVKGYKRILTITGLLGILILVSIIIVLSTSGATNLGVTINDGNNGEYTQNYEKGQTIIRPDDPVRNGYRFVGWFDESDKEFDFDKPVTQAVKIHAKWELINYTITYLDENNTALSLGGSYVNTYTIESPNINLQSYLKDGKTFDGWYESSKKITQISTGSYGNRTFKAKFDLTAYTIIYLDEDDTVLNLGDSYASSYTIESETINLQPYSDLKTGKTFDGWYENSQKITQISTGSYGNRTFKAKFTLNSYEVSVSAAGGGVITLIGEDVRQFGEEVTITVDAYEYWSLDTTNFWFYFGLEPISFIEVEPNKTYTFIMPAGDVSVFASFITAESYFYVTVINASAEIDYDVSWQDVGLYRVGAGASIYLEAFVSMGHYIEWWVDGVLVSSSSTDNHFGRFIYGDTTIEAVYTLDHDRFRVTLINAWTDGSDGVWSLGGGLYEVDAGTSILLTAHVIPSGHTFIGWMVDDVFTPGSERYLDIAIYYNTRIEAVFTTQEAFSVTVINAAVFSDDEGSIISESDDLYVVKAGSTIHLYAAPPPNHSIMWTIDGILMPYGASTVDIFIYKNTVIEAIYVAI